jgi:hypothetical protein
MKRIIFAMVACLFSIVLCAQSDGQKWLAEARKGNIKAMHQTAIRYYAGYDGLPKDLKKAVYWAEKAANSGNTDAMLMLYSCYNDVKENRFESKKLYWAVKAAQTGDTKGMKYARSAYSLLGSYVTAKDDKIKCVEQQIYWNNKMMEHPEIDSMVREQCERNVNYYNYELEKLKNSSKSETKSSNDNINNEEPVLDRADNMPSFPGGVSEMFKWLGENTSNTHNSKGMVITSFVVEKSGDISNIVITKSLDQFADEEVLNVIKKMPKWTPGMQDGKTVRVKYSLPISFK